MTSQKLFNTAAHLAAKVERGETPDPQYLLHLVDVLTAAAAQVSHMERSPTPAQAHP